MSTDKDDAVESQLWATTRIEAAELPEKNVKALVISVKNAESGKEYTVTVVGDPDSPDIDFHTALRTAVYSVGEAFGAEPEPGTHEFIRSKRVN
jgi:hypothetical protein